MLTSLICKHTYIKKEISFVKNLSTEDIVRSTHSPRIRPKTERLDRQMIYSREHLHNTITHKYSVRVRTSK